MPQIFVQKKGTICGNNNQAEAFSVQCGKNNTCTCTSYLEVAELQEANSMDLYVGLHSGFSGTEMIDLVPDSMRPKICASILEHDQKTSIRLTSQRVNNC